MALLMKYFQIVLLALLVSGLCGKTLAFYEREPLPLSKVVQISAVVATASLTKYSPIGNQAAQETQEPAQQTWTFDANQEAPLGIYTFRISSNIKGDLRREVQLTLPQYHRSGRLGIKDGQPVLLLLRSNPPNNWVPTEPLIPFIKLDQDHQDNKAVKAESALFQVVNLIIDSLHDPVLRRNNIGLLKEVIDPQIPQKLPAYADDADILVQDNVLYSLATNQQAHIIPHIARLNAQLLRQNDSNAQSIVALQKFKTPTAVPYLNPLLFEFDEYIRVNTVYTLQDLADATSIPYLLLALRDPEPQNVVDYTAYRTLHRLIPKLGRPKDWSLFQIQREAESRRLYEWWKDELAGKHTQPTIVGTQSLKTGEDVSTYPVEKLNPLLFEPVATIRQKVMATLDKRADYSSVPYLLVALEDPDFTVSYNAYTILHQLITPLEPAKSREYFEANREVATRPIRIWWVDELTGNHILLPKEEPQMQEAKGK